MSLTDKIPAEGSRKAKIISSSVLLPDPFGPFIPTLSPLLIVSVNIRNCRNFS